MSLKCPKKFVWGKISYKKYHLDMGTKNKFEKKVGQNFFLVIFKEAIFATLIVLVIPPLCNLDYLTGIFGVL